MKKKFDMTGKGTQESATIERKDLPKKTLGVKNKLKISKTPKVPEDSNVLNVLSSIVNVPSRISKKTTLKNTVTSTSSKQAWKPPRNSTIASDASFSHKRREETKKAYVGPARDQPI